MRKKCEKMKEQMQTLATLYGWSLEQTVTPANRGQDCLPGERLKCKKDNRHSKCLEEGKIRNFPASKPSQPFYYLAGVFRLLKKNLYKD